MEAATPSPQPPPRAARYPVVVEAERQDSYHRFLPLVKWLLAIPHYFVLAIFFIGVFFAKIAAFFAVLFTGRYPRGIFDFVTGVLRWSWNVFAYVYLLTDRYPPFSLEPDPSYPARFEIDYPERVDRWRPLVHWLLIIPYAFVAGVAHDRCRDRRLHRRLRDPVHGGPPRGDVQADPDPLPVAAAGERLRLLHGHPLPTVRVGRAGALIIRRGP